MNPSDYSKDMGRVKRMLRGEGILGWIVKKMFGKKQSRELSQLFDQADTQLTTLQAQQAVAQAGTPAKARVLKIEDTRMFVNNWPVAVLTLRVMPEGADEFDVTLKTPVSRFNFLRADDVINVKYNPENTHEVAIV